MSMCHLIYVQLSDSVLVKASLDNSSIQYVAQRPWFVYLGLGSGCGPPPEMDEWSFVVATALEWGLASSGFALDAFDQSTQETRIQTLTRTRTPVRMSIST